MELQLKQLKGTTIKDLKQANKEKQAEIEVLKEMVKSANLEVRAKDIDIQKLKNRLQREGSNPRNLSAARRSQEPPLSA